MGKPLYVLVLQEDATEAGYELFVSTQGQEAFKKALAAAIRLAAKSS